MPADRVKHRRVVHKSTAGILKPIPEAVDLVGNASDRLTTNTVAHPALRAGLSRRGEASRTKSTVSPVRESG